MADSSPARRAPARAKSSGAERAVGIQQLGDDLLGRVLLFIPQGQRMKAAGACKAWNQLLRRPDMWTTVEYPRRQLSDPFDPHDDNHVELGALHWLTARCRATRTLHIEGTQQDTTFKRRMVDGKFQMLLLAFAAAPALAELHVQLPDHLAVASQSLVHVKLLHGLTKLHIHGVSPPVTADNLNSLFSALPALQACSLGLTAWPKYPEKITGGKVDVPTAMYSCTQLTRLEVYDLPHGQTCLNWGGLTEGITALQQLARLRLGNVLTAPLIHAVSELTKLTSIALCSEDYNVFGGPVRPSLLPDAATSLTGICHLDIDGITLPPALEALTGVHDLTLRNMGIEAEDLAKLGGMQDLSRLSFYKCDGPFWNGKILEGLDWCNELHQLHINDCGMCGQLGLAACRVLRQVTELRMQDQMADMPIFAVVADAMPQLVTLDISFCRLWGWPPSETITAMRRCVSLRRIVYELPHDELDPETANAMMELQWAVPHVRWYLSGAPRDCFDETRKFRSKDYFGDDMVTR